MAERGRRGQESLILTGRVANGRLPACHDDCELPADDTPAACQIGPRGGWGFLARNRIPGVFFGGGRQANARSPMRAPARCAVPNHRRLVRWPRGDGDLSEFMRWFTVTHAQRLVRGAARGRNGLAPSGPIKFVPDRGGRLFAAVRGANPVPGQRPHDRPSIRNSTSGAIQTFGWILQSAA